MACVNAKSIKRAFKTFFKEHGRDPNLEEARGLINGRPTKKNKGNQNAKETKENTAE